MDNEYVKIEKLIGGIYHGLVKRNLDLSREMCRKELNRLYSKIEEKLENYTNIQQFYQDLENLKTQYQDSDQVKTKQLSQNY